VRFKNGLHLIKTIGKKIVNKYAELMNQAQQAIGRKEAVGLILKAAKLKLYLITTR